MARRPLNKVLEYLRRLVGDGDTWEITDGDLLMRFVDVNDEAAFELLVQRHGPMVLKACQRVLADPNDAEDVYQAAFMVLARKAHALERRRSLGSWLYKVAYRLALNAKSASVRRGLHERRHKKWRRNGAKPRIPGRNSGRSSMRP